jgi:protein-L-isoaspartate(D-aspartate) O-methyltransferase
MNTVPNRPANSFQILLLAALLALQAYAPSEALAESFAELRRQMVQYQLKGRDISDARVLKAMSIVPRHRFVPEKLQKMAYQDTPLPIGHGQTISQPYIVALMSQLLAVKPGQRILEIGTGSGYQAAVLAEMGASVYSIEIVPELGRQAQKTIEPLGYETIHLKIGDGYQGWPRHAPFDGIIVTCAPTRIPVPLKTQLAEAGRMVIPVGPRHHQQLVMLTKEHGEIRQQKVVDVRFVPMVDASGRTY